MKVSMKTIVKELFGTACGVLVILFIGYLLSLWGASFDEQADTRANPVVVPAPVVAVDPSILLIQNDVVSHKTVLPFNAGFMEDGKSSCSILLSCNNAFAGALGWETKRYGYFAVVRLTKDGTGVSAWLVQMQGNSVTVWRPWEGSTEALVKILLEQQYREKP